MTSLEQDYKILLNKLIEKDDEINNLKIIQTELLLQIDELNKDNDDTEEQYEEEYQKLKKYDNLLKLYEDNLKNDVEISESVPKINNTIRFTTPKRNYFRPTTPPLRR